MNYLLDTCTISYFFKKNHSVIRHLESVTPMQIHLSAITFFEVEYGLKLNPKGKEKFAHYGIPF